MRVPKVVNLFVALALAASYAIASDVADSDPISIANKVMLKNGYKVEEHDIALEDEHTEWNRHVERRRRDLVDSTPKEQQEFALIQRKLKGREFRIVVYRLKPIGGNVRLGGALVFLDKKTGEVLLFQPAHMPAREPYESGN